MLNDLAALKALGAARGVRICVDCISSIGAVPVDLTGVHLATGTSSKALRAYPGIAPAPARLPHDLDLGCYAVHQGIPFTFSSNLLRALHAAVRDVNRQKRFTDLADLGALLREQLPELGLNVLG